MGCQSILFLKRPEEQLCSPEQDYKSLQVGLHRREEPWSLPSSVTVRLHMKQKTKLSFVTVLSSCFKFFMRQLVFSRYILLGRRGGLRSLRSSRRGRRIRRSGRSSRGSDRSIRGSDKSIRGSGRRRGIIHNCNIQCFSRGRSTHARKYRGTMRRGSSRISWKKCKYHKNLKL